MDLTQSLIIYNEPIANTESFYRIVLKAPEIAAAARPGQFIMLTTSPGYDPFLKRPMGINIIDREKGYIGAIYQVNGKGTQLLTKLPAGDTMSLLGPLGNGWNIADNLRKVCLLGGGSGVASLLPLAKTLAQMGVEIDFMLGGKSKQHLICLDEFTDLGNLLIATEDGSCGKKGLISVYFSDANQYDMVFCCGPTPMMRVAAQWAEENALPCQVSLEERMGCGYGVCVGCVCETRSTDGSVSYKRICREGPIFDAKEVFGND